jgi:hypothetical protein
VACFARFVPDFDGQAEAVIDDFAAGLVEAIDCLRRQQAAKWQN